MNNQSIEWNERGATEIAPVGIVIIGASVFYTPQTCVHIESEFHVRCVRLGAIEALNLSGKSLADVRLLIVDQALAEDLLARPESYRAAAPEASLALAYRDVEAARSFLRRCDEARHGPIGYLSMNAPLEVSLSSIRMLFHREYFLPCRLLGPERGTPGASCTRDLDDAWETEGAEIAAKLARLTEREREVLSLVSAGQSNKEIARRLGITEHTVKLHNHNLCTKFGVANRTAAASLYHAAQRARSDAAR